VEFLQGPKIAEKTAVFSYFAEKDGQKVQKIKMIVNLL
jgi:hypothetical protein